MIWMNINEDIENKWDLLTEIRLQKMLEMKMDCYFPWTLDKNKGFVNVC